MQKIPFSEAVRAIRRKDARFDADAYAFLRDSLDYTVKELRGEESEEHRHVSGGELVRGLRDHALEEFGPLAATVLENWGITRSEDVGEMVFQLIELGAFGQSDDDDPADFANVFDFDEAFRAPFRPRRAIVPRSSRSQDGAPPTRGITPRSASSAPPPDEAPEQTLN